MALSPLLTDYDNVLIDLDGCVWVGSESTRGAADAIGALRAEGKAVAFVTNDARRSPEEYVRKLWSLGVRASLGEVVTVGGAIQHVLAERASGSVYVIGSPALFRHVSDAGQRVVNGTSRAREAELVVVAGHDELAFDELRAATQAVLAGAQMLGSDRDRSFPTDDGLAPGTGAVLAALEYATGSEAQIVGKPEPQIFHTALDRLGRDGRTLVIGDRVDSDLLGAAAAGLNGAIVLTGVSTREEAMAAEDPRPVAVAADLHSLLLGR